MSAQPDLPPTTEDMRAEILDLRERLDRAGNILAECVGEKRRLADENERLRGGQE